MNDLILKWLYIIILITIIYWVYVIIHKAFPRVNPLIIGISISVIIGLLTKGTSFVFLF